jgi:L,D-transpeptidase ErfK/SrfK
MKKIIVVMVLLGSGSMYASIDTTKISMYDTVRSDVKVKHFFSYIEKLVAKYNDTLSYEINEYTLVNNNPWIIDSLAATDYYFNKNKGVEVMNQKEAVILHKNDVLKIPTQLQHYSIAENLAHNSIYINIPEYKLKIWNENALLIDAPIRVGRNESKYLKSIDKYTDLRTRTGTGVIYDTEKNPTWINPADNHKYTETTRDDKVRTKMPQTPSIRIKLNGVVTGQLIHATTNPATLGKAYSNGCLGTNEYDIWYIYYYCPPGTPIKIEYNLATGGDQNTLEDIYDAEKHVAK